MELVKVLAQRHSCQNCSMNLGTLGTLCIPFLRLADRILGGHTSVSFSWVSQKNVQRNSQEMVKKEAGWKANLVDTESNSLAAGSKNR